MGRLVKQKQLDSFSPCVLMRAAIDVMEESAILSS